MVGQLPVIYVDHPNGRLESIEALIGWLQFTLQSAVRTT